MTDHDYLEQLNKDYCRASLESNVEWYRDRLTDDFALINFDAVMYNKTQFLKMIGEGTDQVTYDLDQVNIRIYGDVALVRAIGLWTTSSGKRGASHYIDVYVRSGSDWKVVSAQITRPS